MRTKRQNRKVCSSLRFISSSPGHWQTSKLPWQGRVLSSRKIDFQTTLSSRSQLESSAGEPFSSRSAATNQTQTQEVRATPLRFAGINGSATSDLEGQNDNFFCRTKVFQSVNSIAYRDVLQNENWNFRISLGTKCEKMVHVCEYPHDSSCGRPSSRTNFSFRDQCGLSWGESNHEHFVAALLICFSMISHRSFVHIFLTAVKRGRPRLELCFILAFSNLHVHFLFGLEKKKRLGSSCLPASNRQRFIFKHKIITWLK